MGHTSRIEDLVHERSVVAGFEGALANDHIDLVTAVRKTFKPIVKIDQAFCTALTTPDHGNLQWSFRPRKLRQQRTNGNHIVRRVKYRDAERALGRPLRRLQNS